ncbi:MAG TPA: hypothetical protein VGV17_02955 [Bosea sp. (in: a-proteobacteria)]|jgi:hypothetical protein|uniref:hypothetical protein n=1 Tax=Bosea sp. (in: a-proteobacteria) TaxID=1871050 RepID=UPI002DDD6BEE|nr:hypothetical protein [Bosea sp. (in: a-proteobacteria)]HEV2552704.1 hypothetical protein [Bosea sp. (in: a-proteobacteria)]
MPYVQRTGGAITALSLRPVWQDGEPPALLTDPAPLPDDDPEVLAFLDRVANPVPVEVARHQALLALLGAGITRAMIESAIAAIADPVEREVTDIRYHSPRWRRDSDFIAWGKTTFDLTDAQVADLFTAAAAL